MMNLVDRALERGGVLIEKRVETKMVKQLE